MLTAQEYESDSDDSENNFSAPRSYNKEDKQWYQQYPYKPKDLNKEQMSNLKLFMVQLQMKQAGRRIEKYKKIQ